MGDEKYWLVIDLHAGDTRLLFHTFALMIVHDKFPMLCVCDGNHLILLCFAFRLKLLLCRVYSGNAGRMASLALPF